MEMAPEAFIMTSELSRDFAQTIGLGKALVGIVFFINMGPPFFMAGTPSFSGVKDLV